MNEDKEIEESPKAEESPARETRRTRTSAKGDIDPFALFITYQNSF